MEERCYKALNFDLSTHQFKEIYPGTDYRKAYDDLRQFFNCQNFSHRQGSGYLSNQKLLASDVYDSMAALAQELSWIGACINKMDVTNVGRQYDLIPILKEPNTFTDENITS